MLNNAKRLKINRLKLAYIRKNSYLCGTKELVINPLKLTIMDRKIFIEALENHKAITGTNGKGEVWHISSVQEYQVCVEHRIWIAFDNSYLTLNNVVAEIIAYELTELIHINWHVED